MTQTEITVQYERKFSDGAYGSEGLSMTLSLPIENAELGDGALIAYARKLRIEVLSELAKSAAPQVARAASRELNPPAPVVAGHNFDADESPF